MNSPNGRMKGVATCHTKVVAYHFSEEAKMVQLEEKQQPSSTLHYRFLCLAAAKTMVWLYGVAFLGVVECTLKKRSTLAVSLSSVL